MFLNLNQNFSHSTQCFRILITKNKNTSRFFRKKNWSSICIVKLHNNSYWQCWWSITLLVGNIWNCTHRSITKTSFFLLSITLAPTSKTSFVFSISMSSEVNFNAAAKLLCQAFTWAIGTFKELRTSKLLWLLFHLKITV